MTFFPSSKIFLEISVGFIHLTITYYAMFILTGAVLAYELSIFYAKRKGYKREILDDYFFTMLPLAIIGARLYYCLFSWQDYASDPISIFYIWEGGLAIHGGLIVGILYSIWYFHHCGVNFLRMGDCIMPNVFIGQIIGRWGNFMNQEAYGDVVSEEYFAHFPTFIKEKMYIYGQYRMPMFLYEGIGNTIGFLFITFVFRKHFYRKRGDMIYAYLSWYGMVRFFVEMFRTDALHFFGLKIAQIVSLLFILAGILGYIGVYDRIFKNIYPFKHQKPVVLFDGDGTLVDTTALILDSFKHVFKKYKPDYVLSEEELQSFLGPSLRESFMKYFDESMVDELWAYYEEYNLERLKDVKEIKNASKVLSYLKENGYTIALVSNKKIGTVHIGLEACGLDSYFDVVVGLGDFKKPKPAPDSLLLALDRLVSPVDNVIYVGDAVGDVLAARNMCAYSIAYVNEHTEEEIKKVKPCRIIHDLIELIDIVQEDREWNEIRM